MSSRDSSVDEGVVDDNDEKAQSAKELERVILRYIITYLAADGFLMMVAYLIESFTLQRSFDCTAQYVGWTCTSNCNQPEYYNSTNGCAEDGQIGYDYSLQIQVIYFVTGMLSLFGAGTMIFKFVQQWSSSKAKLQLWIVFNLAVASSILAFDFVVVALLNFLGVADLNNALVLFFIVSLSDFAAIAVVMWNFVLSFNLFLLLLNPLRFVTKLAKGKRLFILYGALCWGVAFLNATWFTVDFYTQTDGRVLLDIFFAMVIVFCIWDWFVFLYTCYIIRNHTSVQGGWNAKVVLQTLQFTLAFCIIWVWGILYKAVQLDVLFTHRVWAMVFGLNGFINFLVWRERLGCGGCRGMHVRISQRLDLGSFKSGHASFSYIPDNASPN